MNGFLALMNGFLALLCAFPGSAALAEGTDPTDRVIHTTSKEDQDRLQAQLAPYVALSRKMYPEAKAKFLKGLPPDHVFALTHLLRELGSERYEQIYVTVEKIEGGIVEGRIASEIGVVQGYKRGDRIRFEESEIRDWTIVAPDGSEEGNYVGKFIDVLHDGVAPLIIKMEVDGDGTVTSAVFTSAVNRYQQDVSYCIPEEAKRAAEKQVLQIRYEAGKETGTRYTYVMYLVHENRVETPEETKARKARSIENPTAPGTH